MRNILIDNINTCLTNGYGFQFYREKDETGEDISVVYMMNSDKNLIGRCVVNSKNILIELKINEEYRNNPFAFILLDIAIDCLGAKYIINNPDFILEEVFGYCRYADYCNKDINDLILLRRSANRIFFNIFDADTRLIIEKDGESK